MHVFPMIVSRPPPAATRPLSWSAIIPYLYLYKFENVCLSVCLFARVFLGHLESDWDTLWHKAAFRPRMSSKTINFKKSYFSKIYCNFSIFLYDFSAKLKIDYINLLCFYLRSVSGRLAQDLEFTADTTTASRVDFTLTEVHIAVRRRRSLRLLT